MRQFRRILHPTDFSKASRAAFAKAVTLAKRNRAELLVVHVLPLLTPFIADGYSYVSPKTYETMEAAAKRDAQLRLAALVARARNVKVRARGALLDGTPHQAISRTARSKRADLIVMGTHGRTGLSKFFLGSVAARVIPLAPCPVLTVRGK